MPASTLSVHYRHDHDAWLAEVSDFPHSYIASGSLECCKRLVSCALGFEGFEASDRVDLPGGELIEVYRRSAADLGLSWPPLHALRSGDAN